MKAYIINAEQREGGSKILGAYLAHEVAIRYFKTYLKDHYDITDPDNNTDDFGSDISKGCFYSEEESIEVIEREAQK